MSTGILIACLLVLLANLAVAGLTAKLYTEFIKEKKYRQP